MDLHFRTVGEGQPFIILHGLFGSSDNLMTAAKAIAEHNFQVFVLDARNHGQSPRSTEHSYTAMANDLSEFIEAQGLSNPIILGHSMGGKTVMQYAANYTNYSKVIVVDIAPKPYKTHHEHIIEGLKAINPQELKNRREADEIFAEYVPSIEERQFILKNLYRTDNGFDWRINIESLSNNIGNIGEALQYSSPILKETLFINGGNSAYIKEKDFADIKAIFTNATIKTIDGANHWVHATKPKEFLEAVLEFSK